MINLLGVHRVIKLPASDLSRSRTSYESVLPVNPRLQFLMTPALSAVSPTAHSAAGACRNLLIAILRGGDAVRKVKRSCARRICLARSSSCMLRCSSITV